MSRIERVLWARAGSPYAIKSQLLARELLAQNDITAALMGLISLIAAQWLMAFAGVQCFPASEPARFT